MDWAAKIEASLTTKSKTNRIIDTYQVMILDKEGVIREPLYLNNNHEFTKYIYISYNKNHFSVITSMRALTRMDFYCDLCKKGFHRSDTHHCAKTCHSCKRLNCAKDLRNMRCTQCKIY